jgi:hypothetical protein
MGGQAEHPHHEGQPGHDEQLQRRFIHVIAVLPFFRP